MEEAARRRLRRGGGSCAGGRRTEEEEEESLGEAMARAFVATLAKEGIISALPFDTE